MNNKSISINEPYEINYQQTLNFSNVSINRENKVYEEKNFDFEKSNNDKYFKNGKKSEELEPFSEYKKMFIITKNTNNNKIDCSKNLFNSQTFNFKHTKVEKDEEKKGGYGEEKKEENKDEENEEEKQEENKKIYNGKKNKFMGRKRKNSLEKGNHDKYSVDNLYRKIKSNLLNILYIFINYKIIEVYKDIPNYDLKKDVLRKIEQKQIVNSGIEFNQKFLKKKLKDIFSVDISHKYRCKLDYNKKVINKLLKQKDKVKKKYFKSLFNLTFLDCLKHFRGSKTIPILDGIKSFEQFKVKFINDNNYLDSLDYYVMNYENVIMNKNSRKPRNNN